MDRKFEVENNEISEKLIKKLIKENNRRKDKRNIKP